jgi:hypothetical protein
MDRVAARRKGSRADAATRPAEGDSDPDARLGRILTGTLERAGAAATIMLCHTLLGAMIITGMWAIERLIGYLGHGGSILIYDRWPIAYLFQTIDIMTAIIIGGFGLWETAEVLRRRRS